MSSLKNKSNKKPLITVFTVNWNGQKWLKKYFQSLDKQTYNYLEIIVIDNASTDNSVDFIKKHYPHVKVVENKKNVGLASATNTGFKYASGEYVLFLNNDTWFEKDFIEKLFNYYSENSFTAVSAVEKRYFDDAEFHCNTTIDPLGSPAYFVPTYSRPDKLFYLTVCFLCSKKDFVDTNGMDNDFFMYYEDVDWFWKLHLLGKSISVTDVCAIHHAGAGSTGTGIKYSVFLWRNQNALQTLLKNYSTIMLLIILPLYLLQNVAEVLYFLIIRKPTIAYSYIQGWVFNLRHLSQTLRKRHWIQKNRMVNDITILKKMYMGSGKLLLLRGAHYAG